MLSLGRKSRVVSVTPGGDDMQVLIEGLEAMPDGVAVDPINRHLYYTFMGAIRDGEDFWENDGYIERANFDGSDRTVIVPAGTFVTGKQIQCDAENGRLYWSDREGLGVMSCRLDGSDLTIHVRTGSQEDKQDRRRHCAAHVDFEPGVATALIAHGETRLLGGNAADETATIADHVERRAGACFRRAGKKHERRNPTDQPPHHSPVLHNRP